MSSSNFHRCLVWNCKRLPEETDLQYYKFTKHRYRTWINAIGRNAEECLSYENKICSKHFSPKNYTYIAGNRLLKKDAVPDVNLRLFHPSISLQSTSPKPQPTNMVLVVKMLHQQNHKKNGNLTLEESPNNNSTQILRLNLNTMDLICRICLKVHEPCCNMFEYSQNSKFVSEMVTEFTSINVRQDDGFPKNICSNCLEKLYSAQNLKTLANKSDTKLRNFYNSKSMGNNIENSDSCIDSLNVEEEISIKIEDTQLSIENNDIHKREDYSIDAIEKNELTLSVESNDIYKREDCKIDGKEKNELNQLENKSLRMINEKEDSNMLPMQDNNMTSLQNEMSISSVKDNFSDESRVVSNNYSKGTDISPEDLNGSRIFHSSTDPYKMPIIKSLSRAESNTKTLYCNLCKRSFGYRYYVSVHIHQHTGNTPHKCEECGKTFVHASILKKHALVHSDKRGYSCNTCGKTFKFLSGLSAHQVTHFEERPYKCTICNEAYKLDTVLKIHMRRHKNTREHVCEVCGFAFVDESDLTKHMKSHSTEKSFICSTCGKGFITKRCYTTHIKLHSDFKPYACTYCEKRFHSKQVLKNHIKVHMRDKLHCCRICDQRFRQRICLVRHMRMHSEETRYSCT